MLPALGKTSICPFASCDPCRRKLIQYRVIVAQEPAKAWMGYQSIIGHHHDNENDQI